MGAPMHTHEDATAELTGARHLPCPFCAVFFSYFIMLSSAPQVSIFTKPVAADPFVRQVHDLRVASVAVDAVGKGMR